MRAYKGFVQPPIDADYLNGKSPRLVEQALAGFVLFLSSSAVRTLMIQPEGFAISDVATDGPHVRILFGVGYLLAFLVLLPRFSHVVSVIKSDPFLVCVVALALASVSWSADPAITIRRAVALAGTTLFGMYLAVRFSLRQFLTVLCWVLVIIAVTSVLFALALPTFGTDSVGVGTASWRGVFVHKNILGRVMLLSVLTLWLSSEMHRPAFRKLAKVGVVVSMLCLVLSRSLAPLVVLVALILVAPILRRAGRLGPRLVPYLCMWFIGVGTGLFFLGQNVGRVVSILGRDLTLTGRTALWSDVVRMIDQRPFLGQGFNAFWLGWDGPSGQIWAIHSWKPPHSHNGWLDISLELGLVGLAALVVSMAISMFRALRLLRRRTSKCQAWPSVVLLFISSLMMVESVLLAANGLVWIIYVFVACNLALTNREELRMVNYERCR